MQTLQRPSSGTQRFEALWPGEARLFCTTYWKITIVVGQRSCLSDRLFLEKCFRPTYEFSSILEAENILTMNQLHIRTKQHLYVCLCFCCKGDCPRLNVGVYVCVFFTEKCQKYILASGMQPPSEIGGRIGWSFLESLKGSFNRWVPNEWPSCLGKWHGGMTTPLVYRGCRILANRHLRGAVGEMEVSGSDRRKWKGLDPVLTPSLWLQPKDR